MILAVGLSPAWQQILSFEQFSVGEVNRAKSAIGCASGKVLNVGCALFHLGVPVKTLCPVGGPTGQQISADFDRLGIPVRWLSSAIPTRSCITILDEKTAHTTELVENCAPVPEKELSEFLDAFGEEAASASVVVLTGSLPQGAPPDFFRQMLERTSAKAVLDIRGSELENTLPLRPFVVKPNRDELAKTVGHELKSEEEILAAMAELRDRGAEWVVVSQGPGPLLALGPEGVLRISPPEVQVCNPIGCGDCLAAGIAAGIEKRASMQQSLEWGVAAAAENAITLLPARKLSRLP